MNKLLLALLAIGSCAYSMEQKNQTPPSSQAPSSPTYKNSHDALRALADLDYQIALMLAGNRTTRAAQKSIQQPQQQPQQ